jgi:hypothetical protein
MCVKTLAIPLSVSNDHAVVAQFTFVLHIRAACMCPPYEQIVGNFPKYFPTSISTSFKSSISFLLLPRLVSAKVVVINDFAI